MLVLALGAAPACTITEGSDYHVDAVFNGIYVHIHTVASAMIAGVLAPACHWDKVCVGHFLWANVGPSGGLSGQVWNDAVTRYDDMIEAVGKAYWHHDCLRFWYSYTANVDWIHEPCPGNGGGSWRPA